MVLPTEPEFEQARNELAITIAPFLARHPEYERAFEIVQVCPISSDSSLSYHCYHFYHFAVLSLLSL